MLTTLTLVVLLSASEGSQELALHDAAQTALGENANVAVRVATPLLSADAAVELVQASHGDAIAIVEWLDAKQRRAEVQVYRQDTQTWLRRTIEFATSDSIIEQGRSLGFAIAAMLPDPSAAARTHDEPPLSDNAEPAKPPAAVVAAPASTGPAATATPRAAVPVQPTAAASATRAAAPARLESRTAERRLTGSIDATVQGALALGRTGNGLGGGLGAQLDLGNGLGLRFDLAARGGRISALNGTTFVIDAAPGFSFTVPNMASQVPLALELRLAAFVRYMSVSSEHGGGEVHTRWLPGARLSAGAVWAWSRQWALVGSIGLDSAFGKTEILQKGSEVSSIGPFAWLGVLGIRIRL